MSTITQQTAKTEFVSSPDPNGIKYAYRRLGLSSGTPLLFLMHFRGNMDHWDPLLINALALQRPLILFDNAGVGRSSGAVADSIAAMATHTIAFLALLGITTIDILGFSIGGCVAQLVALNAPLQQQQQLVVRKLVLAGTSPSVGADTVPSMNDEALRKSAGSVTDLKKFLTLFFRGPEGSKASVAAAEEWWVRMQERTLETSGEERVGYLSEGFVDGGVGAMAQAVAGGRFQDPKENEHGSYDRLGEIKVPVFVGQGLNDFMIPSYNSYVLFQRLPNAYLHMYPDSGHGFLFQYAKLFAKEVGEFLDGYVV